MSFLKKYKLEIGLIGGFLALMAYNASTGSCGACNAGIALLGLGSDEAEVCPAPEGLLPTENKEAATPPADMTPTPPRVTAPLKNGSDRSDSETGSKMVSEPKD